MESEETGGTGQRGGGECLGRCRLSALGATQGLVTRDAVSIGEAVLRVLGRIEGHLAALPIGKRHAEITRGIEFTPQFVVPVFGQHICITTGNSDTFNAVELEADVDLQEIGKALCFDARAIDARAGADVDVDRSDAHTRPLALSASQVLIRQAPWNARMIAPSAVVYGKIASMGQDSPLPERIDSPPAFAIVALPHSNEGELKWLTTSELRTCPTQEPNRPWRLKCGNCFAPNMRRNTRLLSPNLRSTADALMPLSDNQTLFGDNFPDGVEFALGVVLFFASDESVDTLGDFNITIGEADATKGNVLFFKRTHVVFLSAVVMGVSFPQAAWRSFTISESALVSLCSASTVAPFFLRFQREGVVGSTPARSQISDIGTRCSLALANSASMGFVFSMFRHAIGRRA